MARSMYPERNARGLRTGWIVLSGMDPGSVERNGGRRRPQARHLAMEEPHPEGKWIQLSGYSGFRGGGSDWQDVRYDHLGEAIDEPCEELGLDDMRSNI